MCKPAKDNDRRATRLDGFQHVMGTILVLEKPLLIHEIVALLSDIPKDKFDVTNFLQQMRSVLIPGTTTSFDYATPQMHKSFRDYIMSDHAPPEFRILTRDAHFMIARGCLDIIVKAGRQGGNGNEYAVTYWYRHMDEAGARCDDERMWTLLGEMVNEGVVGVWSKNEELGNMFMCVASTGWKLLKVRQKSGERQLRDDLYGRKKQMSESWCQSATCWRKWRYAVGGKMANLALSANDAFLPLHPYPTHLPHLHTILVFVSSWCVFLSPLVCIHRTQTPLPLNL